MKWSGNYTADLHGRAIFAMVENLPSRATMMAFADHHFRYHSCCCPNTS
jgi:hypothetical protein